MYFPQIPADDVATIRNAQIGPSAGAVVPNLTPQIPALNQPPVQMPQLQASQIPAFLPNPLGYSSYNPGGMPFIRNRTLGNVLSPLMQPNYGIPPIMYGNQQPMPVMNGGGGLGFPGGQWGIQPIRGGVG